MFDDQQPHAQSKHEGPRHIHCGINRSEPVRWKQSRFLLAGTSRPSTAETSAPPS